MTDWQAHMRVPEGQEWDRFTGVDDPAGLQDFLGRVAFFRGGTRRLADAALPVPEISLATDREISTQGAFGKTLTTLPKRTAIWPGAS